ncbi:hypothetical protein MCOR27_007091 [Pyricularia oryzae]|uniref:HIT-type domain-containing protein n=2 Tax=Pyricularia TaxID=48558 RepID=A0ABQ8NP70_PYRGI|nr:hypothetical protein MCOR01_002362 [Pyricularia oryzae]KAI6300048.1 hypothetical protein MCOR33_004158 [Pyricularia grisea]KAH9429044.1 hypothetical protein MCOR02_010456 [Pyricularia oryzae]KAI6256670.1 hypothetical protein MCOR19_006855 [Pyricularia oryzae]KAI6267691.1 hypothetical protein MCOR26_009567 [Pyricularia oryzae]
MNNFGVVEVASTRTTNAPGWAYVPDTGINPAVAALQPTNRKRAARNNRVSGKPSLTDLSARQEAAVRKEVEQLDRDAFKDTAIPVPARTGGSRASNKHTPNVRKILMSQKTFANHVSDYEALQGSAEATSSAATPRPSQPHTPAASTPAPTTRTGSSTNKKKKPAHAPPQPPPPPAAADVDDVDMADAPPLQDDRTILPPYAGRTPAPHRLDDDPLLRSHVPKVPTDNDLRPLLLAPPMPYPELMARASAAEGDNEDDDDSLARRRYPMRVFCSVCGYWGKVRCIKCNTRVCALDCLEVHREECVTRYGL